MPLRSLPAAAATTALALSFLASPVSANVFGVDVSTPVSASAAKCMADATNNLTFGIARAWYSDGAGFDKNSVESVASWRAAGMAADVYMFPCSFGRSAASQVSELLANLSASGVGFNRIWFDVETNPSRACAWSTNKTKNCEFMQSLVAAAGASNA